MKTEQGQLIDNLLSTIRRMETEMGNSRKVRGKPIWNHSYMNPLGKMIWRHTINHYMTKHKYILSLIQNMDRMRKEKIDQENQLENEQELLFNTLGKQMDQLNNEKRRAFLLFKISRWSKQLHLPCRKMQALLSKAYEMGFLDSMASDAIDSIEKMSPGMWAPFCLKYCLNTQFCIFWSNPLFAASLMEEFRSVLLPWQDNQETLVQILRFFPFQSSYIIGLIITGFPFAPRKFSSPHTTSLKGYGHRWAASKAWNE